MRASDFERDFRRFLKKAIRIKDFIIGFMSSARLSYHMFAEDAIVYATPKYLR